MADLQFIKRVVDELPLGVWVAKVPTGEEVYANARFAEIMGTELIETQAGEYAQPYGIHTRDGELYPESRLPFVRALQAGGPVEQDDIVIHRHDGQRVYIRAHARPIFDERGQPELIVIAFQDISREVRARQAEAVALAQQKERTDHHGVVLIADDMEYVRLVTAMALERLGFEVRGAVDGAEALEIFAQERDRIRAVFLDVRMPRVDGREAFARIREMDSEVPVVFLTGYTVDEERDALLALGANGFIPKPLEPRAIEEELLRVLQLRGAPVA